ncbi:MAG: hypothetical protein QXT23_06160 [Acidilobaceae archaeon]
MSKMVKCPFCGFEAGLDSFKLVREPWRYSIYEVKRLECPRCKNVFNYYEGVTSTGKHSTFIIKKRAGRKVMIKRETEEILEHNAIVNLLIELGGALGFHVTREESSPDKLYRYDCVWRDAPGHAPLKVFEVEFKGDIDKALARLAHAHDMWRPELYLIIADERELERARKLVEPRLSGAFTRIKNKLTILSPTTLFKIFECLSKEELGEIVKQLSKR